MFKKTQVSIRATDDTILSDLSLKASYPVSRLSPPSFGARMILNKAIDNAVGK